MTMKAIQKQLVAAVAMLLVAAIALSSATYAWFVNNTAVTASTATMTAQTAYTLLISKGAKASDGSSEWTTAHEWADGKESKELAPVSTIGALNTSNALDFVYDTKWASATTTGTDIVKGGNYATAFQEATNTRYIKESFEIKAMQDCQLILDKNTVIAGSTGELDKVLRLALVIDDGTDQTVRIYQVDKDAGSATQINTTMDSTGASANGIAKAINASGVVADVDTAVKKLSLDTAGDVNAADGASAIMINQGNANSVLYNFVIGTQDTITVTAYIWMEGCDYDCNALETQQFKDATSGNALPVTAKLGFSAALPT